MAIRNRRRRKPLKSSKMKDKFELGPLQKLWVSSLRENCERQGAGNLGYVSSEEDYSACCLGELLLCRMRLNGEKIPEGNILDGVNPLLLTESYKAVGLYSDCGLIYKGDLMGFNSLSSANDGGVSWSRIANFIEDSPEKVFTKPV